MPDTKNTYRVKPGCVFGAYRQYAPGATVELTEAEAGGFLDALELVARAPSGDDLSPGGGEGTVLDGPDQSENDEAAALSALTIAQLKELPEYAELENPKPRTKADILKAILEARGLLPEEEENE